MRIIIPGNPIAKMRARHVTTKNFVRTYDPQDALKKICKMKLTKAVKDAFSSQNKQLAIETSKLGYAKDFDVSFYFYMEVPKSDSIKEKNLKLWNISPHNKKPDTSNMIKFYEDCANEILFEDDSMITSGRYFKCYSKNPRTEINIMPKKDLLNKDYSNTLSIFEPDDIQNLIFKVFELGPCSELRVEEMSDNERESYFEKASKVFEAFAELHIDKLLKLKKLRQKDNKIPMEGRTLC